MEQLARELEELAQAQVRGSGDSQTAIKKEIWTGWGWEGRLGMLGLERGQEQRLGTEGPTHRC